MCELLKQQHAYCYCALYCVHSWYGVIYGSALGSGMDLRLLIINFERVQKLALVFLSHFSSFFVSVFLIDPAHRKHDLLEIQWLLFYTFNSKLPMNFIHLFSFAGISHFFSPWTHVEKSSGYKREKKKMILFKAWRPQVLAQASRASQSESGCRRRKVPSEIYHG